MNEFVRKAYFSPLFLIIILLAFVSAGVLIISDLSVYTPDSARYMIWAKSLASFEGFKDATGPEITHYVVHAPLYAVLLTPVAWLYPDNLIAAKIETLFFGLIAIILAYYWLQRSAGNWAAGAGAFLLAGNALFLLYSTEVLSDIPFLIVLVLFFILNEEYPASRQEDGGHNAHDRGKPVMRKTLGLSLVIACSLLVREVGAAALLAQLIYCIVKKNRRQAIVILEVSLVVFLAWLIRNEWIVASRELPAFTNGKIFTHHFFTSADDPLIRELFARISVNAKLYAASLGGLLFFPMFGPISYSLLYLDASFLKDVAIIHTMRLPLTIITIAGSVYGLYRDTGRSPAWLLKIIFLACYGIVILCYPINDIRFLLPVALLGIYYCSLAFADAAGRLSGRGWGWSGVVLAALLVLASFPNFFWAQRYASANSSYRAFFNHEPGADTLRAGGNFARPTRRLAEWISGNTQGDAVLISQIKDIACSIGSRKLLNLNETVTLDEFEHYIRDYHVRYVVSAEQSLSIPDFAFQMRQSRRYAFKPVQRLGVLVVYEVVPKTVIVQEEADATLFGRALGLIDDGKYFDAQQMFSDLRSNDTLNYPSMFYTGVAREFSGDLAGADALLAGFQTLPQSGMYLERSATHRDIIRMLAQMSETTLPKIRADQYASIAASYWDMGFRSRARALLSEAASLDSTCYSVAIFSMYFSLETGDTANARSAFYHARRLEPQLAILQPMEVIFSAFDSLSTAMTAADRVRWRLAAAQSFVDARLTETAIDTYLSVHVDDPNNISALSGLANLYEAKRRFAPALECLRHLAALQPADKIARQKIQDLSVYF